MTISRKDLRKYGNEYGIPATAKQTAQMMLADSRDSETEAMIWHDNGATVERLAQTAGVKVVYIHVDLTQLTTERRTVENGVKTQ